VAAGFDEPVLLFIGCVAGEPEPWGLVVWATAVAARADITVKVAKTRRMNFSVCN
jgi:hypothetical protein